MRYGENSHNRVISRRGYTQEGVASNLPGDHRRTPAQENQNREPRFLPPDGAGAPEGFEVQPRLVLRGNPPWPASRPAGQADRQADGGVHFRVERGRAGKGRSCLWV